MYYHSRPEQKFKNKSEIVYDIYRRYYQAV